MTKNVRIECCGIEYKYYNCFLEYMYFQDDLVEYTCFCCNRNYKSRLDKKLKHWFFNRYNSSNHSNNKFILFIKFLSLCEWLGKINKTSLPEKGMFLKSLEYGRYYWCKLCMMMINY